MKKKLKKKKVARSYRNLIITLLSISAVVYYAVSRLPHPQPTPIGINEVAGVSPTVTLSMPATVSVSPGTESNVDIMVNTGGASVTAVQVELSYDSGKIGTPTLTQGDFLTDKLGNPKIKDGRIFFVYTAPLESKGKSGEGKLATLKFKPTGDSQISFGSNTMVAAIDSSINMLKSATGVNIQTTSNPAGAAERLDSRAAPVLSEIKPAPPLATSKPTPTPRPQNQAGVAKQLNSLAQPSASFLPEQDFDYSSSQLPPTPPTTDTSSFTRFLIWIKSIFGGTNAQN